MNGTAIAELVPQLVALAWSTAVGGYLLIFVGATLLGGNRRARQRVGQTVLAALIMIGIPAALTAFASLFVLPLLLAMPLPLAGWAIGAALGFALSIAAYKHPDGGHEGCTKLLMTGMAAYITCLALWAIAIAAPPVGAAGTFIKPLLLATPFAALGAQGRKGNAIKALTFGALAAFLLALGFVPIEQGFARDLLPASPWLKYPIGGAVALSMWIAVPRALILVWSLAFKVRIRKDDSHKMIASLAILGAILGLLYAGLTVLGL